MAEYLPHICLLAIHWRRDKAQCVASRAETWVRGGLAVRSALARRLGQYVPYDMGGKDHRRGRAEVRFWAPCGSSPHPEQAISRLPPPNAVRVYRLAFSAPPVTYFQPSLAGAAHDQLGIIKPNLPSSLSRSLPEPFKSVSTARTCKSTTQNNSDARNGTHSVHRTGWQCEGDRGCSRRPLVYTDLSSDSVIHFELGARELGGWVVIDWRGGKVTMPVLSTPLPIPLARITFTASLWSARPQHATV
jgi:hypothetical protein